MRRLYKLTIVAVYDEVDDNVSPDAEIARMWLANHPDVMWEQGNFEVLQKRNDHQLVWEAYKE